MRLSQYFLTRFVFVVNVIAIENAIEIQNYNFNSKDAIERYFCIWMSAVRLFRSQLSKY